MQADISQFEKLYASSGGVVFNSAAATVLQSYGQARKGADLCKKYIDQLQNEDFVPAELISQMYTSKEKFDTELLTLKQELMEQTSKEPLDMLDREVYNGLSESAKEDLNDIMKSDEVFRRALEMKDEAAAKVEKEKRTSETEETASDESGNRTTKVAKEAGSKESAEDLGTDDASLTDDADLDLGNDVASEEEREE